MFHDHFGFFGRATQVCITAARQKNREADGFVYHDLRCEITSKQDGCWRSHSSYAGCAADACTSSRKVASVPRGYIFGSNSAPAQGIVVATFEVWSPRRRLGQTAAGTDPSWLAPALEQPWRHTGCR